MSYPTKLSKQYRKQKKTKQTRWEHGYKKSQRRKKTHRCNGWYCKWMPKKCRRGKVKKTGL